MQRTLQYGQVIKIIESPRAVTYREMLLVIKATKSPIELAEEQESPLRIISKLRIILGAD